MVPLIISIIISTIMPLVMGPVMGPIKVSIMGTIMYPITDTLSGRYPTDYEIMFVRGSYRSWCFLLVSLSSTLRSTKGIH